MSRILLTLALSCGMAGTATAQYRGYLPFHPRVRYINVQAGATQVDVRVGRGVSVGVHRESPQVAALPVLPPPPTAPQANLPAPPAAPTGPTLVPQPDPGIASPPPAPVLPAPPAAPQTVHPQPAPPPAVLPPPPVVVQPPVALRPGQFVSGAVPLFPRIKIEDRDNIAPRALHAIIAVGSPDGPGCVFVPVCVPPCPPERVKVERGGREIKLDYGKYEVEIKSRRGRVEVDYDD